MRRFFYLVVAALAILQGCKKSDVGEKLIGENSVEPFKITIFTDITKPIIQYLETKATSDANKNGQYDKAIERLDIFVFDPASGALDGYKSFDKSELQSLSNLEITSKGGVKNIYAVANTTQDLWIGVTNFEQFRKASISLNNEDYRAFVMAGSTTANISSGANVSITVERFVAKIVLKRVRAMFYNTPYDGQKLKNVKVYLTNVHGNKLIATGETPYNSAILNYKANIPADYNSSKTDRIICEELADEVDTFGTKQELYFYCYENLIESENEQDKFTRLVIEAELGGIKYYYPISINREGYGWNSLINHKGIRRNATYSYSVDIKMPGSLSPEDMIDYSVFNISLDIDGWKNNPVADITF